MDELPCSGKTDIWFSPDTAVLTLAENICREECPVLKACGERAERLMPAAGVWGGKRYHKGKTVGRARRTGKRVYGWTPEDDANLLSLRARGMTWGQISVSLDRDEGGCYKRWKVLMEEPSTASA